MKITRCRSTRGLKAFAEWMVSTRLPGDGSQPPPLFADQTVPYLLHYRRPEIKGIDPDGHLDPPGNVTHPDLGAGCLALWGDSARERLLDDTTAPATKPPPV